jgi:hypothetical protein
MQSANSRRANRLSTRSDSIASISSNSSAPEHGPWNWADLANFSRACDLWGVTSQARVQRNEAHEIFRVLKQGIQSVIVPQVRDRSDAIRAIDATFFTPKGARGAGLSRQKLRSRRLLRTGKQRGHAQADDRRHQGDRKISRRSLLSTTSITSSSPPATSPSRWGPNTPESRTIPTFEQSSTTQFRRSSPPDARLGPS